MPLCFLSCARDDDEPFVERLRDRLTKAQIDVWWDRSSMTSRGRRFLLEIDDAIRSADWFVLISGPSAARSDYVAHELAVTDTECIPCAVVLRGGDRQDVPWILGSMRK
jgi:hypothetical protein